jgi:hypothetical protein
MRGTMTRLPDGTLTARLVDPVFGYVSILTGTRTAAGYDIEVRLAEIPDEYWLPGDQEWFEVAKS